MKAMHGLQKGLALCCFIFAAAWAVSDQPLAAQTLFKKGDAYLQKTEYQSAIETYQKGLDQAPFGSLSQRARLALIEAFWRSDHFSDVIADATLYLHYYPHAKHSDYALFMRMMTRVRDRRSWFQKHFGISRARFDLTEEKRAFEDGKTLIAEYPNSAYHPFVEHYLRQIKNDMALHDFNIAKYYFDHHYYLAAANRLVAVLHTYPQATCLNEALSLLKKTYAILGLHGLKGRLDVLKIKSCSASA